MSESVPTVRILIASYLELDQVDRIRASRSCTSPACFRGPALRRGPYGAPVRAH